MVTEQLVQAVLEEQVRLAQYLVLP